MTDTGALGKTLLEMWEGSAVASTVAEGWSMAQETIQAAGADEDEDGPTTAELELANHIVWLTHWWYLLRDERQEAMDGKERMLDAVRKYGKHLKRCEVWSCRDCDCGLEDTIR